MGTTASPVADRVEDNDNRTSPPGTDCLGTPVILRIIMEHLSNTELLAISLVNKLWNYEARSVMKNRGSLIARLKSKSPCQKLAAFASDLRQMNVVPFSGINIALDGRDGCEGCEASSAGTLDPNCVIILDRIPWKCLKLDWRTNWEETKNCQALLLALKILQDLSEDLEEFKLRVGERSVKILQQILQNCKFPQLKTVDLRSGILAPGENCTVLIKTLVSRAPNLQELHELCLIDLKENVLEASSAVLTTHGRVRPAYDDFSEGIYPALRLTHMILEVKEHNFSLERFNRITPLLLQNSKATLESIHMDAVFALPLMCYDVRMENVTMLTINLDYQHLKRVSPRVLIFLKAFDFTRMFPNLKNITLEPTVEHHMGPGQMNELIWQGSALLNEPVPDPAANITELHLSTNLEDGAILFLAQMFPNTKRLRIYKENGEDIPYGIIWEHFTGLTKLVAGKTADYYQHMRSQNLDSLFCGIFPEEVAELRSKDDEYLKSVNIVPVMPAITCLSGLKSFDMAIWDQYCDLEFYQESWGSGPPPPREHGTTFLLSKVTCLIAFARMPSLSVSMHSQFPELVEAMSHLKPYARVYLED